MKQLQFYKYHGAGNDFIIIDNREKFFNIQNKKLIKSLCHRRFGVGADGIMLVEESSRYDFKMIYINSDGSTGSMCGNGGRCIVSFVNKVLKIIKNPKQIKFEAVDGVHEAQVLNKKGVVKLKMQDVSGVSTRNDLPFVCQGTTPHNIFYVKDLKNFPVLETGRKIRYSDKNGVNTNFVEIKNNIFNVRTYERGVEDETLACGTGATSVAIASHYLGKLKQKICHIRMPGGKLVIEFSVNKKGQYNDIWLTGPTQFVYSGILKSA